MPSSKLEYFIEHVSQWEKDEFRGQLANSRRKRDEVLLQVWDVLQEADLTHEELYAVLYPGKAFSDKQIRNLRSELFRKLTDFLAYRLFLDSSEMTLFVARAMNQLHATRHFPALLDKYLKQEADKSLSLDQADFNNRLRAEILLYQAKVEGRKNFEMNELLVGTETAFVARVVYQAVVYHSAHKMFPELDEVPPIRLWPAIVKQLEEGAWADSQLVQIYYSLYQMVTAPELHHRYVKVKETLTEFSRELVKREAKEIYTNVLNHCIRQLNQGEQAYRAEVFHLYKEMLERDILIQEDGIEPWHFKSVVTAAILTHNYNWARNFMEEYSDQLPPGYDETIGTYLKGRLAFAERRFEKAESYMHRVLSASKDPFVVLDARSYLLRIYYENQDDRALESLLTSFRIFLRRHKHLRPQRLKNYQEFIRFFRRLVSLPPDKPKRAEKLKAEIEQSEYHAGRDWFLDKLGEILPHEKQA